MGQYHKFMNFDKKEVIEPSSFRKLTEWNYQLNDYLLQVEKLLKTTWKGDNVLVIGDYVEDFYNDKRFKNTLKQICKNNSYNEKNIYNYPYKKVSVKNYSSLPTRYIYNHKKHLYIDLKKQPIQYIQYDEKENCIYARKFHPLGFLLSCSNGAGGGDYYSSNCKKVGDWVNNSKDIELSDNLLDLNYKELIIPFDENETKTNNEQLLANFLSKNFTNEGIKNIKFGPSLFLTNEEIKSIIEITKEKLNEVELEIEI